MVGITIQNPRLLNYKKKSKCYQKLKKFSRPVNQNSLEYIFNECNLSVSKKIIKVLYFILIKLEDRRLYKFKQSG